MNAHPRMPGGGFWMQSLGASANAPSLIAPINAAPKGSATLLGQAKDSMNMRDVYNRRTTGLLTSGIQAGARIANARGICGALGCLALTLDDRRPAFLTSHHVLFGAGAREQEPVWIADERECLSFQRIARARHGRCGTVSHGGINVHVDCATAELDEQVVPRGCRVVEERASQAPTPAPGDRVTKSRAATGNTQGIVVDANFSESAWVDGRRRETAGQILVRPLIPGDVFTADGDSGAVLRNHDGVVVGLLWGADARGYGLACPIAPVLRVLHVCLARFESAGIS